MPVVRVSSELYRKLVKEAKALGITIKDVIENLFEEEEKDEEEEEEEEDEEEEEAEEEEEEEEEG